MSETLSNMLALGTKAPDFDLPDVLGGERFSLSSFADKKALLIMFICRHCPYVVYVQEELATIGRDYASKDIGILAISANDAEAYPDDAPQSLKNWAGEIGLSFPLCYDESQDVAKSYTAACTPDFFLFGAGRQLVYRGQLDDSRPNKGKAITGSDLRGAIDALLDDRPLSQDQKPSLGCNIKWKPGNEPPYVAM